MNIQKCSHHHCQNKATRVLRSHHNIYEYFCQEHFDVYRKSPAWTFSREEDNIMRPLLEEAK